MGEQIFTESQCGQCADGQVYDPTCSDKVATAGQVLLPCPSCRGLGVVRKLAPTESLLRADARLAAALAELNVDAGTEPMPAWML